MSKQVKLSEAEIEAFRRAEDAIADIKDWGNTAEGVDYWLEVSTRLQSMAYHGTSADALRRGGEPETKQSAPDSVQTVSVLADRLPGVWRCVGDEGAKQ